MTSRLDTLRSLTYGENGYQTIELVPPDYQTDRFFPIYSRYEKLDRQIQTLNNVVNGVVCLYDKSRTYLTNEEKYKATKIIRKNLVDILQMINEIESNINIWRNHYNIIIDISEKNYNDRIEESLYETIVEKYKDSLVGYIDMKEYINSRMRNDIMRKYKIAERNIEDLTMSYILEHPEELDINIFQYQMNDPIAEKLDYLEAEISDITHTMKEIKDFAVSLSIILELQSKRLKNIERTVRMGLESMTQGIGELNEAKIHQDHTPCIIF